MQIPEYFRALLQPGDHVVLALHLVLGPSERADEAYLTATVENLQEELESVSVSRYYNARDMTPVVTEDAWSGFASLLPKSRQERLFP